MKLKAKPPHPLTTGEMAFAFIMGREKAQACGELAHLERNEKIVDKFYAGTLTAGDIPTCQCTACETLREYILQQTETA